MIVSLDGRKTGSKPLFVSVRTPQGMRLVALEHIDWLESEANYIRIHVGSDAYSIRGTMQRFEELCGGSEFVRINRATIVNVARIVFVQPTFGRDRLITLRDGTRLTLQANYRERLTSFIVGHF